MDSEEITSRFTFVLRQYFLPLLVGFAGLMFLGIGLISLFAPKNDNSIILQKGTASDDSRKINENIKAVIIDVQGAVDNPGVYSLSDGQRIQDLIAKAGGLSPDANKNWVAKNLNLASKLKDGVKIYVPFEGEEHTSIMGIKSTKSLININSASISDLDSLTGVGLTTASKIIDNRPYSSVEELLERKIVGKSVFEKIKDQITTL